jgi:hypothetical protein
MAKNFLDRFSPNRQRSKLIDWPFAVEGEEVPKVRVSVLGEDKMEAAALATVDYFRTLKQETKDSEGKVKQVTRKIEDDDPVFAMRERVSQVWHAFTDENGQPLTKTIDDMAKESRHVLTALWAIWAELQSDVAMAPSTERDLNAVMEDLKKNTHAARLDGLSLSTLQTLARTLADQLAASTLQNALGG